MFLKTLQPYGFRNLEAQTLSFSERCNFFVAPNGQGKTNVLELIFLMCTLKSFRGAQKKDFLSYGEKEGGGKAILCLDDLEKEIHLHFSEGGQSKRMLRVNGHPVSDWMQYFADLKAVCFSPEDLGLLDGEAKRRRQFVDRLVFQIYPAHLFLVAEYNRVLKHRNALLKNMAKGYSPGDDLDVWTQKLLELSAQLTQYRLHVVGKLNEILPGFYGDILNLPAEKGILSGQMNCRFESKITIRFFPIDLNQDSYTQIFSAYEKRFQAQEKMELRRGQSFFGAHLDDYILGYGNLDACRFASMGQRKTLLLSLRLAELELVLKEKGRVPLLLLDDLTGELDITRIVALAQVLSQKWLGKSLSPQIFITSVQNPLAGTELLKNARIFSVNEGVIQASTPCGEHVDKGPEYEVRP